MTLRNVPKGYTLEQQRQEVNLIAGDLNTVDLNLETRSKAALSIAAEPTASGNGNLAYNNLTGVFTYTPAAFTLNDITTNGSTTTNSISVGSLTTTSGSISVVTGQGYQINSVNVLTSTTLGSGVTSSSLTSVGTLTSLTVTGSISANGGVNVATGQAYKINSTDVLTSTTLGSGVIASSLTSVGTLSSLTVTGAITANGGVNVATGQAYQINGSNVLTSTTLGSGITSSSLTSVGTLTSLTVTGAISANGGVNVATGQAYQINGSNVLTSTTLGSGVTTSSLTSVGTLASLTVTGTITANGRIDASASGILFDTGSYTGSDEPIKLWIGNSGGAKYFTLLRSNGGQVILNNAHPTGQNDHRASTHSFTQTGSEYYALFNNGTVKLYHPASANGILDQKFETTASGIKVSGTNINLSTSDTPASSTATGTTGDIRWDSSYIYVCVATNTWKRASLGTW